MIFSFFFLVPFDNIFFLKICFTLLTSDIFPYKIKKKTLKAFFKKGKNSLDLFFYTINVITLLIIKRQFISKYIYIYFG